VGIKYYKGVAHPGEYIKLVREPTNPYDRNAIRVDNIRNEKVGHIKATTAIFLAPVMDRFISMRDTTMNMDGTISLHGGNPFTLPLLLDFHSQSKTDFISDFAQIHDVLQSCNTWNPSKALLSLLRGNEDVLEVSANQNDVVVTNQTLDWKSAQQNLDLLFDQLLQDQLKDLPDVPMPSAIITPLLDHQIDGIRWLCHHETTIHDVPTMSTTRNVPFYKPIQERGRTVWLSEITNATQSDPPPPILGSILYVQS
jgi:SWI/SNF-related matrix-associated actin-dependent regulator of chromatin subfamily A3